MLRRKNSAEFDKRHQDFRDAVMKFEASPGLATARAIFIAAFHLAPAVVQDKQIPAAEVKDFEKIVRDADRRSYPKDVSAWLMKNRAGLLTLSRSVNWPDKRTGDEARVGSFIVHNQTGRDVSANIKLLETAEALMRDSGIPRIDDAVYGDVYFVGDIAKRRTTMARYYSDNDTVVILAVKRFEAVILHSILHEFGHRYYQKICKNGPARAQWAAHHHKLARDYAVPLPEPGDVLPTDKGGSAVVTGVQVDRRGNVLVELEGNRYIPADAYKRVMKQRAYPTIYASTDPEEHFCEAFALLCMGELAEPHRAAFEEIVGVPRRPASPAEPPPPPPPSGPKGQMAMFNPRGRALSKRISRM